MKSFRTITLFIITIFSVGILLLTASRHLNNNNNSNKEVSVDIMKENQNVELIDFKINPGQEVVYQVKLNTTSFSTYEVEIWFDSVDKSLENILSVYIKHNSDRTEEYDISSVNDDNKILFSYTSSLKDNSFDLVFHMDEKVGNEGQNLTVDFKTYINVKG